MSKPEISICIPTYKRSEILAKTLEHLASVPNLNMEVVVSDNASNDGTAEVVQSFEGQFPILRYFCQKENVGPYLNACAAYDMATSEYLYWLSDDDRIIPEGIQTALNVTKENSDVLAVFGGYQEWDPKTDSITDMRPEMEAPVVYTPAEPTAIFNQHVNFVFPVVKTSFMQRFYPTMHPGVSFHPVVSALVRQGNVALIPDLLYRHTHTEPRMEFELTENWYHDAYRGDLELALADMYFDYSDPESARQVTDFVSERIQAALMQGYRFACIKKQYLRQRYFIHRANAYGIMQKEVVVAWEQRYILFAVTELIKQMVSFRGDVRSVVIEEGMLGNYVNRLLGEMFDDFPEVGIREREAMIQSQRNSGEYLIVESYETLEARKCLHPQDVGHQCAIYDLIRGLRVTNGGLHLDLRP